MADVPGSTAILLVPKNAAGMPMSELEPLAQELRSDGYSVDCASYEQRGYGVTWYEVLGIYLATHTLDAVTDDVLGSLIKSIRNKAVDWYRRRAEQKGASGPFLLELRDARGKLIKAYRLSPDGNLEETCQAVSDYPPPSRNK